MTSMQTKYNNYHTTMTSSNLKTNQTTNDIQTTTDKELNDKMTTMETAILCDYMNPSNMAAVDLGPKHWTRFADLSLLLDVFLDTFDPRQFLI